MDWDGKTARERGREGAREGESEIGRLIGMERKKNKVWVRE